MGYLMPDDDARVVVWHRVGRPCGAVANEAEGITEYEAHITCPDCDQWPDVVGDDNDAW